MIEQAWPARRLRGVARRGESWLRHGAYAAFSPSRRGAASSGGLCRRGCGRNRAAGTPAEPGRDGLLRPGGLWPAAALAAFSRCPVPAGCLALVVSGQPRRSPSGGVAALVSARKAGLDRGAQSARHGTFLGPTDFGAGLASAA